jgi:Asp/Glu/hydantoin racemase
MNDVPPSIGASTDLNLLYEGLFRSDSKTEAEAWDSAKYRFLLIGAFHLEGAAAARERGDLKATRLMNFEKLSPLLDGVHWELHLGPQTGYGDWAVENREEFALVAAGRLPIVKAACESRRYNAIILLGGGEPGSFEAREIGRRYRIPVVSCAFSQMHIATMLGNKFSVLDVAEQHNMYYHNLIIRHRFDRRCASILNINLPHWRPGSPELEMELSEEREKYYRTRQSKVIDIATEAAISAIEEDGAEVITIGCSGAFWLKWPLEERLQEIGWEIPVLEGYSAAFAVARMMVDLGVDASGLTFPADHPKKWRRKKVF